MSINDSIAPNPRLRRVVTAILLLAGCFLLIVGLLRACGDDYREASYASLQEADRDGAIERGWIPGYLPVSSKNIREFHRIEHSRTWCYFEFLPADSEALRKELTSISVLPNPVARVQRPSISWWPPFLQGDVNMGELQRNGFRTYIHVSDGVVPAFPNDRLVYLFVVNWSEGKGYFYEAIGKQFVQPPREAPAS